MIIIQRILSFHILNMLYPLIMTLLRDFLKEKLQHFPQISDHGGINCNILVDLRCIYIDLQDLTFGAKVFVSPVTRSLKRAPRVIRRSHSHIA